MEWIKKIVLGFLSVVVGLLLTITLLHQFDDELNPEITVLLSEVGKKTADGLNAGVYGLGLFANANDDPAEVGREIVEKHKLWKEGLLNHSESVNNIDYPEYYPENKKLPLLTDAERPCGDHEIKCWNGLIAKPDVLEPALLNHHVILERYDHYLALNKVDAVFSDIWAPNISFTYLLHGNVLKNYQALIALNHGNRQQATEIILTDLGLNREHMKGAPTLLAKMIHLSLIRRDLNLLNMLNVSGNIEHIPEIKELSAKELSMRKPLLHELAIQIGFLELYKDLHPKPRIVSDGSFLSENIATMFFNKNMTMNRTYEYIRSGIDADDVPQSKYESYLKKAVLARDKSDEEMFKRFDFYRNIIGTAISAFAPPYEDYRGDLLDMNLKIRLMNIVTQIPVNTAINDERINSLTFEISNPYDASKGPVINHEGGKLCYEGPKEVRDINNARCVFLADAQN